MESRDRFECWLQGTEDPEERRQLLAMTEEEREEAFGAMLSFGTAGLRGLMGPGTACMNERTVALAARALSRALSTMPDTFRGQGVCISCDCRRNSRRYAEICGDILVTAGIPVLLFRHMRPTPELSFAVRHYGCAAGINVTASHNPKEYNGLKVYGADGGQLVEGPSRAIAAAMEEELLWLPLPRRSTEELGRDALVRLLGEETDEAFLHEVLKDTQVCGSIARDYPVVYTPFHGTGAALLPEALRRKGCSRLYCVSEQMKPDEDFSTVASPNPEQEEGFALAIELANEKGADFILGSDPDADRVAVLYRRPDGSFAHPTFSLTGALLLDWYLSSLKAGGQMPERPVVLKSLVTTPLARAVALAHGADCRDTFTGFKYLTEEKDRLEQAGEGTVVFSYEESYGCMIGDYCRDKDAVSAGVMLACLASQLAAKGKSLGDALEELQQRLGYHKDLTISLTCTGAAGRQKIRDCMAGLRAVANRNIGGEPLLAVEDLMTGIRSYPESGAVEKTALKGENVLRLLLKKGGEVIVRPSGTEPKLRIYLMIAGERNACEERALRLTDWAKGLLN